MAYREINARVKIRRDTAINFTTKNPILLAGELAVEQDTNRAKVGNGSDPWIKLPYLVDMDSIRKLVEEEVLNTKESFLPPIGAITFQSPNKVYGIYANNWLICNGASVSKTIYPDLFSAMGWSDSTHALPNLIDNRFIEGSTSTWQYKNAGLPNIKGGFTVDDSIITTHNANGLKPAGCLSKFTRYNNWDTFSSSGGDNSGIVVFDASRSGVEDSKGNVTSWNTIYSDSVNTVQPKSMTLLPIIRVK